MTFEQYALQYDKSPVLSYKNGKWNVPNPADPEDNLANKWNEDERIPKCFFKWVTTIKKDLFEVMTQEDDNQFGVVLENSFANYDPSIIVCAIGIILKVIERIIEHYSYHKISIKIEAIQNHAERELTDETVKELQELINERREIPVLEINIIHKLKAKQYSSSYEETT